MTGDKVRMYLKINVHFGVFHGGFPSTLCFFSGTHTWLVGGIHPLTYVSFIPAAVISDLQIQLHPVFGLHECREGLEMHINIYESGGI